LRQKFRDSPKPKFWRNHMSVLSVLLPAAAEQFVLAGPVVAAGHKEADIM
jgi:hypothetical protein